MVNGRKAVPEEKAPLNRKCRRKVLFGPLVAGTARPEQKEQEKEGIINEISVCIFGRLYLPSLQKSLQNYCLSLCSILQGMKCANCYFFTYFLRYIDRKSVV